jgi:glycerate kinase
MKIVIAPDSFKGSISAGDLCVAIREGILRVFPKADVIQLPLADGGEGTVDNMVLASHGKKIMTQAADPIGRRIEVSYGVLGDGVTAVIEMARASGLPLLKEQEKNPLTTSSFGTGELILHALEAGYRRFIIGLGGSATNDGGTGMLRALGMRFYDEKGELLPEGGAPLLELAFVDESNLDPRIKESSFVIASDVTNPLCGSDGASAVFGPQKGATPEMVELLDKALYRFAEVIQKQKGIDIVHQPGAGAAGGMGAALLAFLEAQIKPGIEVVMDAIQFQQKIRGAVLVITGEGKLDHQTLSGKVIAGVCKAAKHEHIPIVAICGGMDISGKQMDELGLMAGFSIVPGPCTLEKAMENTAVWATDRSEQMMRLINRSIL